MKSPRHSCISLVTLASAVLGTLFMDACNQSRSPTIAPAAPESKAAVSAPTGKDVYVVFEGPWAFAPDPKDANNVIALAPRTKSHRDLTVQTWDKILAPGIYDLSLPVRTRPATGIVDPDILRAKIDAIRVQHVLDSKAERYAVRLPKPEAYVAATHYRSRADSVYPPDPSTEKDYVTSVSLRYNVATLAGFSLAGFPDNGTFNPLPLRVETPIINFVIDPAHDSDPADRCHTHEREAFRDLTKLASVTLFLDFPNDPSKCHDKDPQNLRPVKADIDLGFPGFFVDGFAGGARQHLLAAIYLFFGALRDCAVPIIVSADKT